MTKLVYLRAEKVFNRILQIQIPGYHDIEFEVVDELEKTDRGNGGFGSTGRS